MTEAKNQKRILGIVFFTILMDLIGFGIVIPIQPFFAESLGASPSLITLLGASYSLMQFLFAPLWGRLSDRVGRRPVMLVSIATTAVGYLCFGFAKSLSGLFLARMLAGLGGANLGTAQAMIADSTSADQRSKGMGLVGAAFGLGFIFGPALGGMFAPYGIQVPIFIGAGLSSLNFLLALWWLPETLHSHSGENVSSHRREFLSWRAILRAASAPNVGLLFAVFFIYTAAFALMEQVLGLFIEHIWIGGIDPSRPHAAQAARLTMYVLLAIGVTATIVQGGLIGRWVRRFGEKKLLLVGMALVSLSLCLIPLSGHFHSYRMCILFSVVLALGSGMVNPSLSGLLSQSVAATEQGGVLGIGQSLSSLGRVVGPAVAGILFEISVNLPFLTGALIILLAFALVYLVKPARRAS